MMDLVFAPMCFSRAAHCAVNGAAIQSHRRCGLNWLFFLTNASGVEAVRQTALIKLFTSMKMEGPTRSNYVTSIATNVGRDLSACANVMRVR